VKQKENIFEELNKMRNLIHTRPGVVISEQANTAADAGTIIRELDKFNSDETKIVNIIKNYKDKASFKGFLDQYKTISGKDFGTDIMRAIQPYNDKTEWEALKTHLRSLGIALTHAVRDPRNGGSYAIFGGLNTPAAAAPAAAAPATARTGNSQVISDYSKQIQTSLGSSPTGKMSSQDLDLILKTLNGEDVSGEVSQALPTDSSGKPDFDKILASL